MRIKIELISKSEILLPVGYNEYIQGAIYNNLKPEDAQWLHDHGFLHNNRKFKLFTFSSILEKGKYDKKNRMFRYPPQISFLISSPVDWILQQLAENMIQSEHLMLGRNRLTVTSINIMKTFSVQESPVKVRAITPVEVHSTFTLENGKKRTHYYTPFDKDFSELVNENLKKKWKAFTKDECRYAMAISPLFSGNKNEKIIYFGAGEKRTLIKGWKGYFRLEGDPEFIEFGLKAGFGSRNSQGFGLVEVVSR